MSIKLIQDRKTSYLILFTLFVSIITMLMTTSPAHAATCPDDPYDDPTYDVPAGLSIVNRPNVCVYYDDAVYTEAQATAAAQDIEFYWSQYETTFGFNAPQSNAGDVYVWLRNDADCNGYAASWLNHTTIYHGCFATDELRAYVNGHEVFHSVQYTYGTNEGNWFMEGTARSMEDLSNAAIDNWDGALTAPFSFVKQVRNYLADTNRDLTTISYNAALWWKYFTEQYGTTLTEPQRGVDAMVALWDSTSTHNDIAAINDAISDLGGSDRFDDAFRNFAVANYTRNLGTVPDPSYNYFDEDEQPAVLGGYGPLNMNDSGAISVGTARVWSESVARYGVDYYSASIGGNCPIITASFSGGSSSFYEVIVQDGNDFEGHYSGSGSSWTVSLMNDGITRITAASGNLANSNNITTTLACADPVIDVKLPNDGAVAYVGSSTSPGEFLAQVLVTDGSPTGAVIAGLSNADFQVRVDGALGEIRGGGFIQQQYWLRVDAPSQPANGTYDLEVRLEESGTNTVIATDTNPDSVAYTSENVNYAIVIDKSGSMGDGVNSPMEAAKDAASMYVDMMRNNDSVSIVPFHTDADPAFAMASMNPTVRTDANVFVNNIASEDLTSIGDGMAEGVAQMNSPAADNPQCSFVLLSDGVENEDQMWADVEASVMATGCPVTTIAFGQYADETLMQEIATATGGASHYNDVYVSSNRSKGADTLQEMYFELADTYEYALADANNRERLFHAAGQLDYYYDYTGGETVANPLPDDVTAECEVYYQTGSDSLSVTVQYALPSDAPQIEGVQYILEYDRDLVGFLNWDNGSFFYDHINPEAGFDADGNSTLIHRARLDSGVYQYPDGGRYVMAYLTFDLLKPMPETGLSFSFEAVGGLDDAGTAIFDADNNSKMITGETCSYRPPVVPQFSYQNSHTVTIDESDRDVLFVVDWFNYELEGLDMVLVSPSGEIFRSDNLAFYNLVNGHLGHYFADPEAGDWEVIVYSELYFLDYQLIVSGKSGISATLLLPHLLDIQYQTGQRVPILALTSPLTATVTAAAEIIAPNGQVTMLPLFDDGLHGDGAAGDGIFGNSYLPTQAQQTLDPETEKPAPRSEGSYQVKLSVDGAVHREDKGSFTTVEGEDGNGNGIPDTFEEENQIDDADADRDLDTLTTFDEFFYGTDPNDSDTDGGGENDGSEIANGQNPFDPSDDKIAAPDYLKITPLDGEVLIEYDVKPEYDTLKLYRATSPNGPWGLWNQDLPHTGVFTDSEQLSNFDTMYTYRLIAEGDIARTRSNNVPQAIHATAVIESEAADPAIDAVAPAAVMVLDDGAPETADTEVVVTFAPNQEGEGFDDITEVKLSNKIDLVDGVWVTYAPTMTWEISAMDGTYATVYALFRDAAGNESEVETAFILFDAPDAPDVPLAIDKVNQQVMVVEKLVVIVALTVVMTMATMIPLSRRP